MTEVEEAGRSGVFHPSGGHLSYIPNAGLYTAALAEFLAAGLNRYTGSRARRRALSAIEHGMVRWMASLFDMGPSASGLILSGGSMANLTGVVAARTARLGTSSPTVSSTSPGTPTTRWKRRPGSPDSERTRSGRSALTPT